MKKLVCLFLRSSMVFGIIALAVIIGFSMMACDDELTATEVDPDAEKGWLTFTDTSFPSGFPTNFLFSAYIISNYDADTILNTTWSPEQLRTLSIPAYAYFGARSDRVDLSAKRIQFRTQRFGTTYILGIFTGGQAHDDPVYTGTYNEAVMIEYTVGYDTQYYVKKDISFIDGNAFVAFSSFTRCLQ